MKTRDQHLAAMQTLLDRAEAESRDLSADEQSEFDQHKAAVDAMDAAASRRSGLAALRQASEATDNITQVTLGANDRLSALFPRAQGDRRRVGDLVRAQLGISASQTIGSSSGGGFTVPDSLSAELLDKARAKTRLLQAGARFIPIRGGSESMATIESDPAFAGHGENETISESEIVFGSRVFVPNTRVCLIRASVELVEDSINFNDAVDNVLAAAFAVEMDRLGLNGNGVGQSLGVLADDNIAEIDGSTFTTWSPLARAYQSVRTSNYTPGAIITSPGGLGAIDELVEPTEKQPLRRPPSLENAAFLDTTSVPASTTTTAVTGEWSNLIIASRTGLTIEATRVGGDALTKLSVLIRAYARFDSFVVQRNAFARVVNIPVPAL